jgi:quercetin dioxygenase-like cupin family protein
MSLRSLGRLGGRFPKVTKYLPVESGKMIVRVWQDADQEGLVDETILEAGDFTQVKPGKIHQFEGLEDGVAFELYWAEFNHDDIVRRTIGTQVTDKRRK